MLALSFLFGIWFSTVGGVGFGMRKVTQEVAGMVGAQVEDMGVVQSAAADDPLDIPG